jgi:hypothetical protein
MTQAQEADVGEPQRRSPCRLTHEQASRPTQSGQGALYPVIRRLQYGAKNPLLSRSFTGVEVGKRRAKIRISKDFMNHSKKLVFAARSDP